MIFYTESESKGPVPAIMTWETLNKKMPWGLIFLVGGGYALAEASQVKILIYLVFPVHGQ